ncbi:MAG: hypothetical protein JSS97_00575 [Actinobacteria bacterium]|nr:hypothetical protein [Actinomycetota bacterium]
MADELLPALRSFLGTPSAEQAGAALREHASGTVVALHCLEPTLDVWVDLASLEADQGARDDAVARVTVAADTLHHLGMDQLSPTQIARAVEERRLEASGDFAALLVLLEALEPLGVAWRATLADHGREDLVAAEIPEPTLVYEIDETKVRYGYVPEYARGSRRPPGRTTRRDE